MMDSLLTQVPVRYSVRTAASIYALLILLTFSCQKPEKSLRSKQEKASAFNSLLQRGRVNHHNLAEAGSTSLLLVSQQDRSIASSMYDEETGALSWISYNTDLMKPVSGKEIEKNCLNTIEARSSDFMLPVKDLSRSGTGVTEFPNGTTIVSYFRTHDEIQIRDSYVDCVYAHKSDDLFLLREIVSRSGGDVALENAGTEVSSFSDLLDEVGSESLGFVSSRKLIKRTLAAEGSKYVGITEFIASDKDTDELYTISLSDGDHELIEAFPNRLSFKDHIFNASVYTAGYRQQTFVNSPLAFATVTGSGGAITLDANGLGALADTDASVNVSLSGPRGAVFDTLVSATVPVSFSTATTADVVILPSTAPQFPALSAFSNIQKVNHFIRRQLPPTVAAILNESIGVRINVVGSCNAFFDPGVKQISLFAAGTSGTTTCPNMTAINDVLYHEWGHGLDNALGRAGGITDTAFSEGIGDIVATYLTGNPKLGQGFFLNTDTEIRSVDNVIHYPEGKGEVHAEGRIIGGAFWDMRVGLIQRYGAEAGAYHAEKLFVNHLTNSDAYLESYENVIRLDDNDGNPATKSPNFCIINAAFAKHGLATLEAGCVDSPEGADVKFTDDIRMGVISGSVADNGKLMVSVAKNIVKVQLCNGSWQKCVPADTTDLEFEISGKKGERLIFQSVSSYSLAEQQDATIIAKDAYGQIVGVRQLKIVSK